MYVTLKLAIMIVLMGTGMEVQKTEGINQPCIFHYEQIMPQLTSDLSEEQKAVIRVLAAGMEGKACSDAAFWASESMDQLEVAKQIDKRNQ